MRAPLGGGTPTTLASGQGVPTGIAIDSNSVYWIGPATVMKVPLAGGTPVTLAAGQADREHRGRRPERVLDDGRAFPVRGRRRARPRASGLAYQNEECDTGGIPYGLALDATSVYWDTWNETLAPCGAQSLMKLTPK